ncbi:MAG: phage tail tube protein [Fibromonadales bacterium]|nr:phage tail tube protein [Fibromonadales bacterium]
MLENTATQDFKIEHAVCFEKQLQATESDIYGGDADNWPGQGDKLPTESNAEFQKGAEYYTDAAMNGTQFNGGKRKTAELPTVASLAVKGYLQGIERILLAGLGYASVAGPSADAQKPGFCKHLFVVPPQGKNQRGYTAAEAAKAGTAYSESDIINTYLCVSQKLGPYAQHARNVAIKDFEIACSAKAPLQITTSGPAERVDKEPSKESAKAWSFGADYDKWFQLSDFKCFLAPKGEALEKRSITEFSLKISHGLSDDNTPTGTSNDGLSRAEPLPSGKSTITLDLTIYLHDKKLYEDWQDNETILQCHLVANRGSYQFSLFLPRLQITQTTPNFDGAGSVQMTMEASWPPGEEELAELAQSFATERYGIEWPQTSVVGVMVVNKENRNPMRGME